MSEPSKTNKDQHVSRGDFQEAIFAFLRRHGSRCPALVTTRRAHRDRIESFLRETGASLRPLHLPFASPFTTHERLREPLLRCLEFEPDVIVAIGGGTVLDLAKLLRFALASGGMFEAPPDDLPESETDWIPMIALPTTAGSGSESTPFAVLYRGTEKTSIEHPQLLPDAIHLDPSLLRGQPEGVRIAAGLDCLVQAIESTWSVRATDHSRIDAHAALETARTDLVPAFRGEFEALTRMQEAARRAGQALRTSRTTLAHALAYGLTTGHGIPHGVAVALVLPHVIRFNRAVEVDDCLDPGGPGEVLARIADLERRLGSPSSSPLEDQIQNLLHAAGISPRLRDHGVETREDCLRIAHGALHSGRAGNNPRRANVHQLTALLEPTTRPVATKN